MSAKPAARRTVVFGASGFAQQVAFWLEDEIAAGAPRELIGFLDDDVNRQADRPLGLTVLGGTEWINEQSDAAALDVVVAVAAPQSRQAIVERLAPTGIGFAGVTHPSAALSNHYEIGRGALIGPNAVISVNVAIGEFLLLNTAATIAHEAVIGDFVTVLPGANVAGDVHLKDRVSIGTNTAVVQGVEIGADTVVGAGATVVSDLPAGVTAVGTPARPLTRR